MRAGRYFGEISMLVPNSKRTATVRAGKNSDLYVLSVDDFREVLTDFPDAAENVEEAFFQIITKFKVRLPVILARPPCRGRVLLYRSSSSGCTTIPPT